MFGTRKLFPAADRGLLLIVGEEGNPEVRGIKVRRGPGDQEASLRLAIIRRVIHSQQAVLSATRYASATS